MCSSSGPVHSLRKDGFVAEASTQGSNLRAYRGHSLHCPHCQAEVINTEPGHHPPTILPELSPPQPLPSSYREEATGASQLLSGNCHYLAPQRNPYLSQLAPPQLFPTETGRGVQRSRDTQALQLLPELGFQRHRAPLLTKTSHVGGALRPR